MSRNLKTLTIGEKQKVLEVVKSGRKKKDIAEEFGIPASTLSTIIKNSKEIDLNFSTDRKRKRGPAFSDVEECVAKWFKQCRDANISIGGPILKEKAEHFAISLGHQQFKASNGWLENFKKRNDIAFRKVCGESAAIVSDENEGVEVSDILTDDDITDSVRGTEDVVDVEEESSEPGPRVSAKQAKAALVLLRTFTEQSSNVDDKVYSALNLVENTIDNSMCKNQT